MSSRTPSKSKTPSKSASSASKPKPQTKPAPPPAKKSTERVTESDDSSDEDLEDTTTSATGEETVTGEGSSFESESATESGNGSADESEEEEEEKEAEKEAPSTYKWTPPPTFKIIPPGTATSNSFTARNLSGKELWFITAPIAAPLSRVDVINPADIAEGLPILQTSSGRSYCLRAQEESEATAGIEVVVVDEKKGGYRISDKKISKSFQLVEELPTPAGVKGAPGVKPVREQPEGLWMRWKPMGYVGALDEDANVPMVDVEVRVPREDGEHRRKKHKSGKEGRAGEEGRKEKKHRSKEHRSKEHKSKEKHSSKATVEA